MKTLVWARHTFRAAHCWPDAPQHRAYLAIPHPHEFGVTVRVLVDDDADPDARSIECHDLASKVMIQARALVSNRPWTNGHEPDLGPMSCESIAIYFARGIARAFGQAVWKVNVEVDEDGVAGATIIFEQGDT